MVEGQAIILQGIGTVTLIGGTYTSLLNQNVVSSEENQVFWLKDEVVLK